MKLRHLFLLTSLLLPAAPLTVRAEPDKPIPSADSLSREKLTFAYGHVKNALTLARGGSLVAQKVREKEAAELTPAELRREIDLMAKLAAADYSKVSTEAQQVHVMAHLRVAKVELTTKHGQTMQTARKRIRKQQADNTRDNPAAELHEIVEAIHQALTQR